MLRWLTHDRSHVAGVEAVEGDHREEEAGDDGDAAEDDAVEVVGHEGPHRSPLHRVPVPLVLAVTQAAASVMMEKLGGHSLGWHLPWPIILGEEHQLGVVGDGSAVSALHPDPDQSPVELSWTFTKFHSAGRRPLVVRAKLLLELSQLRIY